MGVGEEERGEQGRQREEMEGMPSMWKLPKRPVLTLSHHVIHLPSWY